MAKPHLKKVAFLRTRYVTALKLRFFFFVTIPVCYLVFTALTKQSVSSEDIEYYPQTPEITGSRKLLGLSFTDAKNSSLADDHGHNCTPAAILDFPSDGFTREQRRQGWALVHAVIAFYCFWLLALVCDDYFVPAIEMLCKKLDMKEDVAGATFMAAASSSPELFINSVGTFITEGDLGVGTVVGSSVFNILAVPACCGLFAGRVVDLDWWPVTRDSVMYGFAVVALITTLLDGKVMWYEALTLVLAYIFYIAAMYFNDVMSDSARDFVRMCCGKKKTKKDIALYREIMTEASPLLLQDKKTMNGLSNGHVENGTCVNIITKVEEEEVEFAESPWTGPESGGLFAYILKWPISLVLWLTIPDCRSRPRMYPLTFIMCVIWIGVTSYMVAWLITVIGDTLDIPDSVMGLTFLAAGTSVPEGVSSVIVTNQGHGAMGISSSIGSNTFDILLCLGLPWLIKSTLYPLNPGNNWVVLNSSGLPYSAGSLLSTLFGLYLAFALNRFRLDWKIGVTCTLMYIAFLAFASAVELNFFFPVNLPTCDR
ncbi:sodium/potassium/calcium exchanger 3-like [Ctenocephalides felis]|uniref:sodium/potassium/calcium exchanger 3-like n=1 Tax=Ctenocephalides felis TaxID=7515 RepID=UPI000E6E1E23|nr:sodium/potassium/calcium exchanger 3-like [Ctenocephalides felis]